MASRKGRGSIFFIGRNPGRAVGRVGGPGVPPYEGRAGSCEERSPVRIC